MDRLTILYAEDEDTIRILTEKMLQKRVKKIVSAEDGKKALELFDSVNPDILMTDLEMPGMSGLQLIESVKEKNSNIITIVLSGDNELQSDFADYFIPKPVHKKDLLELLEKISSELPV